jgi:hypothetical protein
MSVAQNFVPEIRLVQPAVVPIVADEAMPNMEDELMMVAHPAWTRRVIHDEYIELCRALDGINYSRPNVAAPSQCGGRSLERPLRARDMVSRHDVNNMDVVTARSEAGGLDYRVAVRTRWALQLRLVLSG